MVSEFTKKDPLTDRETNQGGNLGGSVRKTSGGKGAVKRKDTSIKKVLRRRG